MKSKTKVLFFIESLAGGGAEKILYTLVKHIDKDKFDITVSTVIADGIYSKQVSEIVRFSPLIKTSNKFLCKILYHLIYFYLPLRTVYHIFFPKGNDVEVAFCEGFATKLLSYSTHNRKLAWIHIDMLLNPWTQGVVYNSINEEREAYAKYSKILCVSDTVRHSFETKYALKAETVYNPIDSNEIINKSKEEILLPPRKKLRLISVGRLVEQKGYDRLLKITDSLKKENVNFELWILGQGPEKEKLTEYINKNDLIDCVTIWGFVSNPYPYFAVSDLFVCSSRSEGYSTAATEAVILGLPVITTLCAGMKELLGDNKYGIIVDNDDTSLLEPLREAISNPAYLETLKFKAQQRSNDFKISSLMKPVEELLA